MAKNNIMKIILLGLCASTRERRVGERAFVVVEIEVDRYVPPFIRV